MEHVWSFILKLILFCITYFFMLDYLYKCKVSTNVGSIITLLCITIITILYISFLK
jgi:hypothetical protein